MKRNFKKTEAVKFQENIQNNKFRYCPLPHHKMPSINCNMSKLFKIMCFHITKRIHETHCQINETIAEFKNLARQTIGLIM